MKLCKKKKKVSFNVLGLFFFFNQIFETFFLGNYFFGG